MFYVSGSLETDCEICFFNNPPAPDLQTLWCNCRNDKDPFAKGASINLDDLLEVQDDGLVKCFGHISSPLVNPIRRISS